jgi:hypothetical protein
MKNIKMTKEEIYNNGLSVIYRVKLLEGEWPINQDLYTYCNGSPFHYGGSIIRYISEKEREVKVYID